MVKVAKTQNLKFLPKQELYRKKLPSLPLVQPFRQRPTLGQVVLLDVVRRRHQHFPGLRNWNLDTDESFCQEEILLRVETSSKVSFWTDSNLGPLTSTHAFEFVLFVFVLDFVPQMPKQKIYRDRSIPQRTISIKYVQSQSSKKIWFWQMGVLVRCSN